MKRHQLQALVKEIVRVYSEMRSKKGNSSWTVQGNVVTLEDLETPDGRLVGAEVEISGNWDDGAFDYEQGSIKGTHRYPVSFELDKWDTLKVWDMETRQPVPENPAISTAIETEMNAIGKDIGAQMELPTDEPDAPEPDNR